jgi:hypothetical protein
MHQYSAVEYLELEWIQTFKTVYGFWNSAERVKESAQMYTWKDKILQRHFHNVLGL